MQTEVKTYTKTNIQKVAECFATDLSMLVSRTKTRTQEWASAVAYDIALMAISDCLAVVHIQLFDHSGNKIAAHKYDVKGIGNWDQNRPGANNWPHTPKGILNVIASYSNTETAHQLKRNGKLRLKWTQSKASLDYSGMRQESSRQYSSGSYGWERSSFSAW